MTAAVAHPRPRRAPVPNATVNLVGVLAGDTPDAPAEGPVVATATTGSTGVATFPTTGLPAGRYRAVPATLSTRTVDMTVVPGPETAPAPGPAAAPAAQRLSVAVAAVRQASQLSVTVDPDKGSGYWTFRVQKRTATGTWRTLSGVYRTQGATETRTVHVPRGRYRVVLAAQAGYAGVTSNLVTLRR